MNMKTKKILTISIGSDDGGGTAITRSASRILNLDVTGFRVVPQPSVPGPEIVKRSPRLFEFLIPAEWRKAREKEIAALRRTIAGAVLEIAKDINPSLVYVTHAALCGMAGVLATRTPSCPLILGLTAEDVDTGLFD